MIIYLRRSSRQVGAQKYRKMRAAGETPLPKAVYLDAAEDFDIPSRDSGRSIPVRILRPTDNKPIKAVFLHIHGGGWVLQDEKSQDVALQLIANMSNMLCFSIGYRLAPEDPFPAGPHDCYDAAEWLIEHAQSKFGAPLGFVGGESAGGNLSALVALHLLQSPNKKYSSFKLKGLLLNFGAYDLSFTPSNWTFNPSPVLVLDRDLMEHYLDVYCPNTTAAQRKDPAMSPLYADLAKLSLPPALFTCGTSDPLLDDTIFMSTRWMMAGGEAVVKIYPGAPHGYIMFPPDVLTTAKEGLEETRLFVEQHID